MVSELPKIKDIGLVCDRNGRPIYPGDLLKTFHFIGARKKRYYIYHVCTVKNDFLMMTPVCWLENSIDRNSGGECHLTPNNVRLSEIIHGFGVRGDSDFETRTKREMKVLVPQEATP